MELLSICKDEVVIKMLELIALGKRLIRMAGRAVGDHNMIEAGDRIAVGMSGGKDSCVLAMALAALRDRAPVKFEIGAIAVDPTDGKVDFAYARELCSAMSIPLEIVRHPIFSIIEDRRTASPCSFCANMRRGILAAAAGRLGYGKLALGHHLDDAAETALLNVIYAGRWDCFAPKMMMDRSGICVIRPLIYIPEALVASEAARVGIEPLDMGCPHGRTSKRAEMKDIIGSLARMNRDLRGNILNALLTSGVWKKDSEQQ